MKTPRSGWHAEASDDTRARASRRGAQVPSRSSFGPTTSIRIGRTRLPTQRLRSPCRLATLCRSSNGRARESNVDGHAKRLLSECRAAYDAEIAFTDAQVGRLIDALRKAGRLRNAVVVFTSDHGENLGEAGLYYAHGPNVHDASLRIPLILSGHGVPKGVRRDEVAAPGRPPRDSLRAGRRPQQCPTLDIRGGPLGILRRRDGKSTRRSARLCGERRHARARQPYAPPLRADRRRGTASTNRPTRFAGDTSSRRASSTSARTRNCGTTSERPSRRSTRKCFAPRSVGSRA